MNVFFFLFSFKSTIACLFFIYIFFLPFYHVNTFHLEYRASLLNWLLSILHNKQTKMHTHNTASRRVRWEGKRVTRCDKLLLEMCFVFFTSVNLCTLVSYVFWAPKSASLSKQYVWKRCYSRTRKGKRPTPVEYPDLLNVRTPYLHGDQFRKRKTTSV